MNNSADHVQNEVRLVPTSQISTGAGIAIAGIWIGGAAVQIALLLILFVLTPHSNPSPYKDIDSWTAIVVILILCSPMLAVMSATKRVLGHNNHG